MFSLKCGNLVEISLKYMENSAKIFAKILGKKCVQKLIFLPRRGNPLLSPNFLTTFPPPFPQPIAP